MKKYFVLFLCILTCISSLDAKEKKTLSGKIQEFFDQTNIPANISEPEAFYDDVIGVNFLGGSGFIRTQVSDVNPVHISLPRLNVGCGGIDYTMGALNVVSKDEMVKTLKNITKNAATHAFLLGLETVSPLVVLSSMSVGSILFSNLHLLLLKASYLAISHKSSQEPICWP